METRLIQWEPLHVFHRSTLLFTFALMLASLTACNALNTTKAPLVMDELIILNNSYRDMKNVEIRVERVNRVFTCSNILSKAFCSNRFSPRDYQENAITIAWLDNKTQQKAGPLVVKKPADYNPNTTYTAVVELDAGGEYNAYFKQ